MTRRERVVLALSAVGGVGTVMVLAALARSADRGPGGTPAPADSPVIDELLSVTDAAAAGARWYLADRRAHKVHVLDSAGRPVRSFGRQGRGPGELVAPVLVTAGGTRVYVSERSRPDISVFDTSGAFIRLLRAAGTCAGGEGTVVAMTAVEADLYLMRRCMELPHRVHYLVERSRSGEPLTAWRAGDTLLIPDGGGVPIDFPLLAAGGDRLVIGEGGRGCLRVLRIPEGEQLANRCLSELPRRQVPEPERARLARRWGGRVAVPESLPRIHGLVIGDTALLVRVPEGLTTGTWLEVPWAHDPSRLPRAIGRPRAEQSFLQNGWQLTVWEEPEGIRLELVRVDQ